MAPLKFILFRVTRPTAEDMAALGVPLLSSQNSTGRVAMPCHRGHVGENQGQVEADMWRTGNSICSHSQERNRQDRIWGFRTD